MLTVTEWMCPYCSSVQSAKIDFTGGPPKLQRPLLVECDIDEGGCGGLAVLRDAEVRVTWTVRRVEGEGAAEDGGAMPDIISAIEAVGRGARALREALQVETNGYHPPASPLTVEEVIAESGPTLAELPDEVVEQLADLSANTISTAAKAVLGPEHVVVEPLKAASAITFTWTGYYHETERLKNGREFGNLPRSSRRRIVELCGQQIAAHIHEPPTMARWDELKPDWMPRAPSIYQGYNQNSESWPEMARRWHLHAKGFTA